MMTYARSRRLMGAGRRPPLLALLVVEGGRGSRVVVRVAVGLA